jgi:hypothetical protein
VTTIEVGHAAVINTGAVTAVNREPFRHDHFKIMFLNGVE